ncbi:MAG TPA: radical SAM protein [Bryobacteraceae bacterium]|nr:radical SAM protein [Bryobacteraceae bacterium]
MLDSCSPAAGAVGFDFDLAASPAPRALNVELTTKCPHRCIFCTRRDRLGSGSHMDFALFERLIAALDQPDDIWLNFFGESVLYPRLLDAIALAVKSGATTGLVTAFPPIGSALLDGILTSGLDQFGVSLHTMDPSQFAAIYGAGSLDALKRRVEEFLARKAALGVVRPRLAFCFVVMYRNLDQMSAVAEYARACGVQELLVQPLLGERLSPADFSGELSGSRLTERFKEDLRRAVNHVRQANPGFTVNIASPDVEPSGELSHSPSAFPGPLPGGARIHSCCVSPFERMQVLVNGDVIPCGFLLDVPLGSVRDQSVQAVWRGPAFREFRRRYTLDPHPACRACPWKQAYLPKALASRIEISEGMSPQLLRGWYAHEGSSHLWTRRSALALLSNAGHSTHLALEGILPHGPVGAGNSLRVMCNGAFLGEVRNDTGAFLPFHVKLRLPQTWDRLYVELTAAHMQQPSRRGSSDSRDLGAAIQRIEALE